MAENKPRITRDLPPTEVLLELENRELRRMGYGPKTDLTDELLIAHMYAASSGYEEEPA